MNLLLLEPDEIGDDGTATLAGRRAHHVATVLGATAGQRLRAGIVGGPLGEAEVLAVTPERVVVRAHCTAAAPRSADVLLLALPRPKVLRRMLEHAAALGCERIVLFRSWRVDKSHLRTRALDAAALRAHLLAGLEQARRTQLPEVELHARFRPFVEDVLPSLPLPLHRVCAHPTAPTATAGLQLARGAPFALALGPEGGLLPYEVERLAAAGFLPVRCGDQPLRTETALAVLWGQLDLLRQRGDVPPHAAAPAHPLR